MRDRCKERSSRLYKTGDLNGTTEQECKALGKEGEPGNISRSGTPCELFRRVGQGLRDLVTGFQVMGSRQRVQQTSR